MKTQRKTQTDIDELVIMALRKSASTLMFVLDKDTDDLLTKKNDDCIPACNINFRTLAAINEVLMYYGDPGVFAGHMEGT